MQNGLNNNHYNASHNREKNLTDYPRDNNKMIRNLFLGNPKLPQK